MVNCLRVIRSSELASFLDSCKQYSIMVKQFKPIEGFPAIATIDDASFLFDGSRVWLTYQIAPKDGGGCAMMIFSDVIDFAMHPFNAPEGLGRCKYPVHPWAFNEYSETEEQAFWKALKPRLFHISFNDRLIEILFKSVELFPNSATLDPTDALRELHDKIRE